MLPRYQAGGMEQTCKHGLGPGCIYCHVEAFGPPPLPCQHDDPSWCNEECARKREAYSKWLNGMKENAK